jgi:N-acetylneuraminate lyase
MQILKTNGLVAAPFTPMYPDGSLNLDVIQQYAECLHQNGVVGAFVCGTTGEGLSLTTKERRQVIERWVEVAPTELAIIVHVGHNSLDDSCNMALHAQQVGARSIACMAPSFFKPQGVLGMVEWCERVAAAAPSLPFYYYHIPSMTGFNMSVHDFLQIAGYRIPNLAGVKFTYEDLNDFEKCLKLDGGRFDILFGRDELLLSALRLGARGAVGSTYNFAAPLYLSMIDAFDRGELDAAQRLQQVACRMIDLLVRCSSCPIATFKRWMSEVAVECGVTRMPLTSPTEDQLTQLRSDLEAVQLQRWLTRPVIAR